MFTITEKKDLSLLAHATKKYWSKTSNFQLNSAARAKQQHNLLPGRDTKAYLKIYLTKLVLITSMLFLNTSKKYIKLER